MTERPSAASSAISLASEASHSAFRVPDSVSTSSDDPILMTRRLALAHSVLMAASQLLPALQSRRLCLCELPPQFRAMRRGHLHR